MSSELPWFPFYVERFLASRRTRRMKAQDVGVYLLLLCDQWDRGGPIPEDADLEEIGRAKEPVVRRVLAECFEQTTAGWSNGPLEDIRVEQAAKADKRRAAGKAGASARYGKRIANAEQPQCDRMPLEVEVEVEVDGEKKEIRENQQPRALVVENWEPPKPGAPRDYPLTIGGTATLAHDVLGKGLWGDELTQKFNDTKRIIRERWIASGVSFETVQAAIRGLRLMVDREDVEWLKDRKNKPLDGLHVLAKDAVAPGPDGTQLASLFALAERAWREHESKPDASHAKRGGLQRIQVPAA